jgi:hypothetical protein
MSASWPFEDPANFGVLCSRAIFEAASPILLVLHAADGSWQFLDGEVFESPDAAVHVCLEHAYRADPTIAEVASLPRGWAAERSAKGNPWEKWKAEHDS